MTIPGLTKLELTDLSDIKVEYFSTPMPSAPYLSILVVRFTGAYPDGGAGNDNADFMQAMLLAGLHAWTPFGLIIDLTHLKYDWGDMMASVLDAAERWVRPIPFTAIPSAINIKALTSLSEQEMGSNPSDYLTKTLEEAVAMIDRSQTG